MHTFSFDTKLATYQGLVNMNLISSNLDTSRVGGLISFIIFPRNHFLLSRKVIIASFNNEFIIVRGKDYVDSYLYLVDNIKRFNLRSEEERIVKDFSFEYSIVFIENQDELDDLIATIEVVEE